MLPSPLSRIEAAEAEHLTLYGGEVARFGSVRAVFAGPELPVNLACGFGDTLDHLAEAEAFYAARGQPSRLVLYSHVRSWEALAARGYRLTQVLHAHARELGALPDLTLPPGLEVGPVPPAGFARLSTLAFGPGSGAIMERTARRPRTTFLAARLDGQPVAVAALTVFGETALCFSAATLPAFRGRGAQTALLAVRLHAARAAGAGSAAVLTTPGSGSERTVQRAGFVLAGARLSLERP